MPSFAIVTTVECATIEEAQTIAAERLTAEEDYGFEYTLGAGIVVPHAYSELTYPQAVTAMVSVFPEAIVEEDGHGEVVVRTNLTSDGGQFYAQFEVLEDGFDL